MKTILKSLAMTAVLTGVIVNSALSAQADPMTKPGKASQKMEEKKQEFYQAVNATPEQKKKLEDLNTQFKTQAKPVQQEMWDQKKDLMKYMASPTATKAEAMKKEESITQLKTKLDQMYIDHAFEKKAILTPDQQKKAETFIQQQTQKWEEKRKQGGYEMEPKED